MHRNYIALIVVASLILIGGIVRLALGQRDKDRSMVDRLTLITGEVVNAPIIKRAFVKGTEMQPVVVTTGKTTTVQMQPRVVNRGLKAYQVYRNGKVVAEYPASSVLKFEKDVGPIR